MADPGATLTGVPGQLGLDMLSNSSCTEDMLALGEGATGVGGSDAFSCIKITKIYIYIFVNTCTKSLRQNARLVC